MTSYFNLLKYAATGQASPDMTYYDKLRASTLMGGVVQTLTGIPPLDFISKTDKPLISWSMKGNGQQTGTPTPDNTIMPDFCGVRTGNLFDIPDISATMRGVKVEKHGRTIYLSGTASTSGGRLDNIFGTFILKAGIYRFTGNSSITCFLQSAANTTKYYNLNSAHPITIEEDSSWFFSINVVGGTNYDGESISNLMLNLGSTALPYEPYGWKIPFTNAGQTTPVYLGEVPTVRRIKKLVLTGDERDWVKAAITATDAYQNATVITGYKREAFYCSHMVATTSSESDTTHGYIGQRLTLCMDKTLGLDTVEKFKSYLAQQYTAGTPVTVWYVLAEPQTGIVNEPLAKIGDYADELHSEDAGVTIQTVKGENVLTVETDLQPSEMTITFKG